MNRTVKELQLFRHLTLTPSNLINIVFGLLNTLIAAAISAGWQRWLFIFIVMIFLLTCSPDFRDYQALNLSRRYWARHKQRLVVGLGLAMLVMIGVVAAVSSTGIDWILAACVLAVLVYRLVWLPSPVKPLAERQAAGAAVRKDSAVGRLVAMTPVNQIIRVPLGRIFLTSWFAISGVVIVIDVISGLSTDEYAGRIIAATMMAALFTMPAVMRTVGKSLRDWVCFGGTRKSWARETALVGLLVPATVAVAGGLYIGIAGVDRAGSTVTILLVSSLLAPVLAVLFELADRKGTWLAPAGYLLIAAIVLLFGPGWDISRLEVIGMAAAQYLVFTLILPIVARKHVIFDPGVRGWFGLGTAAGSG